jgi:predicted GH43/DUF377 family glycosyl hydrolase
MSAPIDLITRSATRLVADPARVVTQLFVPGQEGFEYQESRAAVVLARVLALSEGEVLSAFEDVIARFVGRHRDLMGVFGRHFAEIADRVPPDTEISDERRMLLGAVFTGEYAIEGAAVCNPSMVAHPDQSGVSSGCLRFVLSVRGIGEGHRSSIGFRTGLVDSGGGLSLDQRPAFATTGTKTAVLQDASVFREELTRLEGVTEAAAYVLDALGDRFTRTDLERQLAKLQHHLSTRGRAQEAIARMHAIADRTYGVEFASQTAISERVLFPSAQAEAAGVEDARFVRFVDDDGSVVFYASYTAYSGTHISQQLLTTRDFQTFVSTPMVGPGAANKGLALFPRRIGGRFAALSRADRESNAIAYSDRPFRWTSAEPCQLPLQTWEVLQLGNCGPPIETEAGWLVLTHGVGPMRTYRIGAILLDLNDPTTILGRLAQPLLSPAAGEQDGYVPNVIYSCGALIHSGNLVLPYGIGDAGIGFATVPVPELLCALQS